MTTEIAAKSAGSPALVRGAALGLGAAAIWGGMYIVSDVVLETIPPFTLLSIRLLMAFLALLPFWRPRGATWLARRPMLDALGVGLLGYGVSVGAQFVGTNLSTGVNGALITSSAPAFIVLFAVLILRERLTRQRMLAVVLATVGVLAILDLTQADFSSDTFAGNLFLGAAAVTWGLFSVLVRRVTLMHRMDSLTVTIVGFAGGLLLTLPAAALELTQRPVGEIDGGILLGVLYLGIVSTAVAMWMWSRAFALVDASIASLFLFAQPVTGVLLGALLLGQVMTPAMWLGALLIGAGVLLAVLRGRA